jgi:hypothetical protein
MPMKLLSLMSIARAVSEASDVGTLVPRGRGAARYRARARGLFALSACLKLFAFLKASDCQDDHAV